MIRGLSCRLTISVVRSASHGSKCVRKLCLFNLYLAQYSTQAESLSCLCGLFQNTCNVFFVSQSLIQCWVGTTDNQRETREKRKKTKQRITVCGRAACFLISFQLYYLKLCWKNHSSLSPALTALHVQSHGCQHCDNNV